MKLLKRIQNKIVELRYGCGLYIYDAYIRTNRKLNYQDRKALSFLFKQKRFTEELSFVKQKNEPIYYIIRRDYRKIGLFSIVITTLARMDYAKKKGYVPVIDMQNYESSYLDNSRLGIDNAWDYYFQQEVSVEEAYASGNFILSDMSIPDDRPNDSTDYFNNVNMQRERWMEFFTENIVLQQDVIEKKKFYWNALVKKGEKVLGVLARGTDYFALKPSGHPIQPDIDRLIKDIEQIKKKGNYQKVFVATEDIRILKSLKEKFKTDVISQNQEYVDYKGGATCDAETKSIYDRRKRGEAYLINLLMLAECDGIIAGRTSGSVGVTLMKKKWDDELFYDLGVYD